MAWANTGGTFNNYDMDSSDGAVAKKLIVRNESATASGDFRAEILETAGALAKALAINGQVEFRRGGTVVGHIVPETPVGEPLLLINANVETGVTDPDVFIGWNAADPDRIEFLIGNKVRFMIDEKGGPNA